MDKPWENEPNELRWSDESTGLQCCVYRHPHFGHLCGYVEIPSGHPLFGCDYSDPVPASLIERAKAIMDGPAGKRGALEIFCIAGRGGLLAGDLFDVHGSITFSGEPYWSDPATEFWYGFDCAHCDDVSPFARSPLQEHATYRDIDYVKAECASLARQIHDLGKALEACHG